MKKIALFVLLATSVAVRWAFAAEEAEDGWISLFNGKNLDGWKASEEPDSFSAHDGILVVQAKGKAIVGQAPHAKSHPSTDQ